MAFQPSIHWVNNQTRLNAQNMNAISASIDTLGLELYGTNNNGLVNTVSTHKGWFTGDASTPNSGVFHQLNQLGQAVLTPYFRKDTNHSWAAGDYDFSAIQSHQTPLPNTTETPSWGLDSSLVDKPEFIKLQLCDASGYKRSLLGPSDGASVGQSYIDALANAIGWNYNRVLDIGTVYRRHGIYFRGNTNTPYIVNDTNTVRIVAPAIHMSTDADVANKKAILTHSNSITTVGSIGNATYIGHVDSSGNNLFKVDNATCKVTSTYIVPAHNAATIGEESNRWSYIYGNTLDGTTLSISNSATISGPTSIKSTLSVSGATTLASTLSVTGQTNLSDNLSVAKNATISGTLAVSKTTTFDDKVTISKNGLAVTGNSSFANNVSIAGALTVNGGATITGNSTFNNIAVNGTTTFNDKVTITANGLDTTGDSIFNNKLNVKEATALESTLAVSSTSTLGDTVTVNKGGLIVKSGGIEVGGATNLKNSLTVGNGATLNHTLLVKGNTTLQAALGVTGAITANDNLSVAKEASIKTLVASTADVKDASGSYFQGTNASSVVVMGTDDDTNTFKGEIKARKAADDKLAKDYAEADSELQKTIVGNDTDTISSNTLKGVINYANAQISAINTALSFLADKDVIATAPSFTFNSAKTNVGSAEVGTIITPSYDITFDAGAYEYTPTATGCTATAYEVTFNNAKLTTSSGSFESVHVTDNTSLKLTAKCTYSEGNVPKNNLGLDYADGKIVSATKSITKTLSGFRQAFGGGLTSKQGTLDSATIRTLSGKGSGKKTFDVTIASTATRVVVAFPSSWGSLTKALDVNDSNKNIVTSFGTAQTVKVSGVTAGADEIEYKVYIMDFASAYGGSGNTYKITISD